MSFDELVNMRHNETSVQTLSTPSLESVLAVTRTQSVLGWHRHRFGRCSTYQCVWFPGSTSETGHWILFLRRSHIPW